VSPIKHTILPPTYVSSKACVASVGIY